MGRPPLNMNKFWLIPNLYYEAKHILVPWEGRVGEKGEKEDENEEGNFRFSLSLCRVNTPGRVRGRRDWPKSNKKREREETENGLGAGDGWKKRRDEREFHFADHKMSSVQKAGLFGIYGCVAWIPSPVPPSLLCVNGLGLFLCFRNGRWG